METDRKRGKRIGRKIVEDTPHTIYWSTIRVFIN